MIYLSASSTKQEAHQQQLQKQQQQLQKQQQKQQQLLKQPQQHQSAQDKLSGPVNGDECYFWRTTGCQFGNNCRWKHVKESKGRDKKPWQRQK